MSATSAMKKITGKKLHIRRRRVLTMRGHQTHVVREFEVFLECGHVLTLPFGRRPQVGRSTTCRECAAAAEEVK